MPARKAITTVGLAYFSKNDIDNAIADWNSAINRDPRDARAYRQRGGAYFKKGDFSLAIADYSRAIELEPKEAKGYFNRGLVYQARDERTKAIADFTTVVTLANDPEATRDAKTRLAELQPSAPERVTAGGGGSPGSSSTQTPSPGVDIAGEWQADVTYSWGDKHPERFTFKQDGNDIFGTASYLRVRRGILDGTLRGNVVQFRTQTETILGNETRTVSHRYRGRISGSTIAFILQSEGGGSSESVEFTASQVE
jgi:tetratricopeptide (TPR) repeat protein